MSKRSEKSIIADVVSNIKSILDFTNEMSYEMFTDDLKTQYAVDRCFEIIGEATRQLPDNFLINHPEIEWQKMIAFRNILIHEYFRVERKIQWNIIKNILPSLRSRLDSLLASLK
jgi:uncharacterized protein with HEPN domain